MVTDIFPFHLQARKVSVGQSLLLLCTHAAILAAVELMGHGIPCLSFLVRICLWFFSSEDYVALGLWDRVFI